MHELGKAIFGGSYDRSGSVSLPQKGLEITSIPEAIKHGIAYTSKDRDNESIVLAINIADNITLPSLDVLAKKRVLNKKELHEFAQSHADRMSVRMTGIKQYVFDLSGGNKQKVVLARWLGRDSDIFVLDSPTRGIDVKVKADIYALMGELKERGKSIIMISEEILELIGMSDRILIMKNGTFNGTFARSAVLTEEDLIAKMV
jgi:ribose transport system ATP-binding protein